MRGSRSDEEAMVYSDEGGIGRACGNMLVLNLY